MKQIDIYNAVLFFKFSESKASLAQENNKNDKLIDIIDYKDKI